MINVIKDKFILPLLRICQFCHTKSTLNTIESIKEFMLHLFPFFLFRLQVCVPVESDTFKGSNELLHEPVLFNFSVVVRFNEMYNVLNRIALSIELIEFRRLIALGHVKQVNSLCIRLCVQVRLSISPS